jgi:hypothetical protein
MCGEILVYGRFDAGVEGIVFVVETDLCHMEGIGL